MSGRNQGATQDNQGNHESQLESLCRVSEHGRIWILLPQTNIELFNQYEKEIQRYQMSGLEYLGF